MLIMARLAFSIPAKRVYIFFIPGNNFLTKYYTAYPKRYFPQDSKAGGNSNFDTGWIGYQRDQQNETIQDK